MRIRRLSAFGLLTGLLFGGLASARAGDDSPWPADKANRWYDAHAWLVGANFIPSTAVNQLEMWQKDTFDPVTIDRELGWAEGIGFNTVRVFLHHIAWQEDPKGLLDRMDQFLGIAQKHHIQPLFVFFDDCWNKVPKAGKQPEPRVGIHNSGWMQDPGDPASHDPQVFPELQAYVTAVLKRFGHDNRILMWDLYNEPGNSGKGMSSMPLLQAVFSWARAAHPDQPISAGIWRLELEQLNTFQATHSDVVTYHNYMPPENHRMWIQLLRATGRPLICTEYMARLRDSRFSNILPLLKQEHVAAINWGLVAGKTNTIYAWDTPMPDGAEPKEWFHDIFRRDGTIYRQPEVDLIRKLTGRGR